jgi:tetratricopeptide (TPR) repeat protein
MKVLELLASRAGEVLSQSEIEQSAWSGVIVTPNSVYQSIAQLRRALGDSKNNPRYIETIARKGYRCIASVLYSVPTLGDADSAQGHKTSLQIGHRDLKGLAVVALLSALPLLMFMFSNSGIEHEAPSALHQDHLIGAGDSSSLQAVGLLRQGQAAIFDGRARQAVGYFEKALTYAAMDGSDHELRAELLTNKARAHLNSDDSMTAQQTAQAAIQSFKLAGSEIHPGLIDALVILADATLDTQNLDQAELHTTKAIQLSERLYGEISTQTIYARMAAIRVKVAQQKWADAEKLGKEVLRLHVDIRGLRDVEGAQLRAVLSRTIYQQGRHDDSLKLARESLQILREIARPMDPNIGSAQQLIADNLVKLGLYREAEAASRECIEVWLQNDSKPWRVARAQSTLGEALLRQGQLQEAAARLKEASRILGDQAGYLEQLAREDNDKRLALLREALSAQWRPNQVSG